MIIFSEIPIVNKEKSMELFNNDYSFSGMYFFKPDYKWLPDFSDMDGDEKENYIFRDLEEGLYFTNLEIISSHIVSAGLCSILLNKFGLVLEKSNPMVKLDGDGCNTEFVFISFEHIVFAGNRSKVTILNK